MLRPLLAVSLLLAAPGAARRTFSDAADGVGFSYPAAWLLNADDDAATAKLRLVDLGQPHAVVQLEGNFAGNGPYRGSDFEAGAFAYTVFSAPPTECLRSLDAVATGMEKPVGLRWHGLQARRLEATFTVAGTDDLHTILVAAEPARCLVFETVLIRKRVGPGIVPLAPTRWAALQARFAEVFGSVRIIPSAAKNKQATGPER